MKKIILYIATSLDGYIARVNGAVDWLDEPEGSLENYGYSDFMETIDTTLMGNTTYQQILTFGDFPYPDKTNYVFTQNPAHKDTQYVQFVSDNVVEFAKSLKQQEGKNIWLIGGGKLNTVFLNADLIDEIRLFIKPVVLGDGIPWFGKGAKEITFVTTSVKKYDSGMIEVCLSKS